MKEPGDSISSKPLLRLSGRESACQCMRGGFDPWVWDMPGEENGNPLHHNTLAWESHGQGNLEGYSPWGHKRGRHDLADQTTRTETQRTPLTFLLWKNIVRSGPVNQEGELAVVVV